jgi:hypothetical protein
MRRDDWKWALGCLGALVLVIAIPLWLLLGPLHSASGAVSWVPSWFSLAFW